MCEAFKYGNHYAKYLSMTIDDIIARVRVLCHELSPHQWNAKNFLIFDNEFLYKPTQGSMDVQTLNKAA